MVANVFLSRMLLTLLVRSNAVKSPAFFGIKIKPVDEQKTFSDDSHGGDKI